MSQVLWSVVAVVAVEELAALVQQADLSEQLALRQDPESTG
ncbi:hypothetical protein [Bellilinea caldifistulae]|nr:hypothetical protein [Bellilinea caldifistulae]